MYNECIIDFFAIKKSLEKEYVFSHSSMKARFIICYELVLVSFVSLRRNPKGSYLTEGKGLAGSQFWRLTVQDWLISVIWQGRRL